MSIIYGNSITVDEVNVIRKSMGWRQMHPGQMQANIDGYSKIVAAYDGDVAVGMAGLIWPGGSFSYMHVVLNPLYQNKGIEAEFVERVFEFLRPKLMPGYGIQVDIVVQSGKEAVYEGLGFGLSTSDNSGIPMRICLTNQIELTDKMFKQMGFR